ncbi:tRNA synthetases class II-domain-containing protein [Annulohypoxylon moriforme]|nr:tRNA synthetases class II-domain-containing protein [Annulohypoxylon moriforme]
MARFLLKTLRRNPLRCISHIHRRPLPRQCQSIFQLQHTRSIFKEVTYDEDSRGVTARNKVLAFPDERNKYTLEDPFQIFEEACMVLRDQPPKTPKFEIGQDVMVYGYIGRRKDMGSKLSFCGFEPKDSKADVQIVSSWEDPGSRQYFAHQNLRVIPSNSPVMVMGTVQEPKKTATDPLVEAKGLAKVELKLQYIRCLNTFPKDVVISKDTVWSPKSRHMQLRFDPFLRDRLFFRTWVKRTLVRILGQEEFLEIETPILFKSTPEGAREFLVPTRRQGYAYALPQSPQQYKQTLMAGGIQRYYQFAKCFRDEDHRADRQPEFTQLDLEMAFATGREVMNLVTMMVMTLFIKLHKAWKIVEIDGIRHPVRIAPEGYESNKEMMEKLSSPETGPKDEIKVPKIINRFPKPGSIKVMKYEDAMGRYGTDKPDMRIELPWASRIYRIGKKGRGLPERFVKMISDLPDPIVEGFKLHLNDCSTSQAIHFIRGFMDNLPNTTLKISSESAPGVFVYDSKKPLNGLSALGHDGVEVLETMKHSWPQCEDGDIIIMHARNEGAQYGGSSDLGRLRTALYWGAVKQGLIPENNEFKVLWVHGFPLFSPTGDEVGQGGTAGICATHHPFTSPLHDKDFKHFRKNPLKAKADHYDLVINGVEVGGGSRRIHVAEVQEYVMRDILKMTDEGIGQFSHLIDALRSGCPPHAGFAIGFDRLISVLLDVPSVRDVIAFPKTNRGEDLLVGSPAKVTPEQKKTYHIFEESDTIPTVE